MKFLLCCLLPFAAEATITQSTVSFPDIDNFQTSDHRPVVLETDHCVIPNKPVTIVSWNTYAEGTINGNNGGKTLGLPLQERRMMQCNALSSFISKNSQKTTVLCLQEADDVLVSGIRTILKYKTLVQDIQGFKNVIAYPADISGIQGAMQMQPFTPKAQYNGKETITQIGRSQTAFLLGLNIVNVHLKSAPKSDVSLFKNYCQDLGKDLGSFSQQYPSVSTVFVGDWNFDLNSNPLKGTIKALKGGSKVWISNKPEEKTNDGFVILN